MAKITGIGGVFFKSRGDRIELAGWYQKHLGSRWRTLAALSSDGRTTRLRIKALLCGMLQRKAASGSAQATLPS